MKDIMVGYICILRKSFLYTSTSTKWHLFLFLNTETYSQLWTNLNFGCSSALTPLFTGHIATGMNSQCCLSHSNLLANIKIIHVIEAQFWIINFDCCIPCLIEFFSDQSDVTKVLIDGLLTLSLLSFYPTDFTPLFPFFPEFSQNFLMQNIFFNATIIVWLDFQKFRLFFQCISCLLESPHSFVKNCVLSTMLIATLLIASTMLLSAIRKENNNANVRMTALKQIQTTSASEKDSEAVPKVADLNLGTKVKDKKLFARMHKNKKQQQRVWCLPLNHEELSTPLWNYVGKPHLPPANIFLFSALFFFEREINFPPMEFALFQHFFAFNPQFSKGLLQSQKDILWLSPCPLSLSLWISKHSWHNSIHQ